jgi:hypothetical protein
MHGPSSGKFEIEAVWHEWVDDVDKPGPERIESHGQLGEIQLAENHVNLFDLEGAVAAQQVETSNQKRAPGNRHEFGDTKFRLIHYTIRATTRFREYLPEALYALRDEVARVGPIADGPVYQVGAADDPGAPVLRQTGTAVSQNTHVLSSAPPDEPRVVYVVPTFRWLETPGNASLDTTRYGNGLRVWLERPWFSSGDGELLGVIILGEDKYFTDITTPMVPLVTQWGRDPLWDTALPKYRTSVSDFTARVAHEPVQLLERDTTVHVIGHRVFWDQTRGMWYADIEVEPGSSYMPFVRLALVRYQPNAMEGAKISKVFLTDFAQVLPRRRAVFQRSGAQLTFRMHGVVPEQGPMLFSVDSEYIGISFPAPFGQLPEQGRNKIEIVLQTRDPALDTDLAWTDVAVLASAVVPVPAPSVATPPRRISLTPTVRGSTPTTVRDGLAQRVDLSTVALASATAAALPPGVATSVDDVVVGPIIDPTLWQTTVTLPDYGGKPARVVVREYERYFTDRTVPEFRAGATRQRRVVEERLSYTAFFSL